MGSAASVERPPFISKDEAKGMVRYEGRKWDEAMEQQFDQNVSTDGDSAGKVETSQAVELYEKYKRETPPPAQPSPKSPSKRKYRDNMRSWVASVRTLDPRQQLAEFFGPGDSRGPLGYLHNHNLEAEGDPSSFFAIFRPTSVDALRMMIEGRATGKGLNIKGKSSKKGVLSGFVPFLQISEEKHKNQVGTRPKTARTRVYFRNVDSRDQALAELEPVIEEMTALATVAKGKIQGEIKGDLELTDDERDEFLAQLTKCEMEPPSLTIIDEFSGAWGIDMPERLMWEVFVMRRDISHEKGWETGRPSEPAFMDMNLHATREDKQPHAVVWQYDEHHPMNPRGLLMAYEEVRDIKEFQKDQGIAMRGLAEGDEAEGPKVVARERVVLPVASDLDAFLIGSKGMSYSPLPPDQVDLTRWTVKQIEGVLDSPVSGASWTRRWLDVLKREAEKGFHPEPPPYGFGDPTSYSIMSAAVDWARNSGAVRHGAECFNFYFPQELDDEFLIVWTEIPGHPWQYVDREGLLAFLKERVTDGFTFPLNPKWVCCDKGWFDLFKDIQKSPQGTALENWYPDPELISKIGEIHEKHPDGFEINSDGEQKEDLDCDMAEAELRRYLALQRAKRKLRAVLLLGGLSAAKRLAEGLEDIED